MGAGVTRQGVPGVFTGEDDMIGVPCKYQACFFADLTGLRASVDTRVNIDVSGREEEVNVITDVNRIRGASSGEEGSEPYDRIQIGFDINTYQANRDPRFEVRDAEAFFPEALQVRDRILSHLKERLDG
jgi:hypothetical protein